MFKFSDRIVLWDKTLIGILIINSFIIPLQSCCETTIGALSIYWHTIYCYIVILSDFYTQQAQASTELIKLNPAIKILIILLLNQQLNVVQD